MIIIFFVVRLTFCYVYLNARKKTKLGIGKRNISRTNIPYREKEKQIKQIWRIVRFQVALTRRARVKLDFEKYNKINRESLIFI
jgi:hypothetical protein